MRKPLSVIVVCVLLPLTLPIDALGISMGFNISDTTSDISSFDGPMDSPWPMQSHDISHTGRSLYTTEDNNGAELWKFKEPSG